LSFMLFPLSGRVYVWRTAREAYAICIAWFQTWYMEEVLWWFGQQYCGILLVPLLPFIPNLLQGSTWTGWVIRCIPWSDISEQLCTFRDYNAPIHTAGTVQSWFKSRLPHLLDTPPTDGSEAVSLMHQQLFTPRKIPGTHFCYRLSQPQGHSVLRQR
jgi:hypothetical protein